MGVPYLSLNLVDLRVACDCVQVNLLAPLIFTVVICCTLGDSLETYHIEFSFDGNHLVCICGGVGHSHLQCNIVANWLHNDFVNFANQLSSSAAESSSHHSTPLPNNNLELLPATQIVDQLLWI